MTKTLTNVVRTREVTTKLPRLAALKISVLCDFFRCGNNDFQSVWAEKVKWIYAIVGKKIIFLNKI